MEACLGQDDGEASREVGGEGREGAGAAGDTLSGLLEAEGLDELKEASTYDPSIFGGNRRKKQKLTHSLFFDDPKGFRRVLSSFPKLAFKGHGHEAQDLDILLREYDRWFKELLSGKEPLEALVHKTRNCLQESQKLDDGSISDPREKLHLLRFAYKNGLEEVSKPTASAPSLSTPTATPTATAPTSSTPLDTEAKSLVEERRRQALERKRAKQAATEASAPGPAPTALDEEAMVMSSVEARRQQALERKRAKQAAEQAAQAEADAAAAEAMWADEAMWEEEDMWADEGY